jgi:AcrR family transcriptional regulator
MDGARGGRDAESPRKAARRSFRKLKPGPGRPAEAVASHQRGRLQVAMVQLVAERGYNPVTVGDLARTAGVSKRDFYRHFGGKEECFLETYDEIVRSSLRGILAAAEGQKQWSDRLQTGFLAFANQIADSPEAARLVLVEAFSAGPAALERMQHTNGLFEALVARNFALADGGSQLPPLVVKGIVAGGVRVARARLLSGHPRQLTLDGEELMDWALSFCDDAVIRLRGIGGSEVGPGGEGVLGRGPQPGDERTLILLATIRLVCEEGYNELTVPRIRAAAGVSRRSFDAHFEGVADCFLAALDMLGGRVLAEAAPAFLAAPGWPTGVHRMIAAICEQVARDPVLAKLGFLEIFCPGPEAIRWRGGLTVKLSKLLRRGAEPAQRPSEFAAEASVGAIWGVIHHYVATDRASRLPKVAPILSYLALAPALGAVAAVDAIVDDLGSEGDAGIAGAARALPS